MSGSHELNPPCERFEHDCGHDDPADPGRKFCWCGWTEEEHPGHDPAEMMQTIRKAHLLITQGRGDDALGALAWFLTEEEIERHDAGSDGPATKRKKERRPNDEQ